MKRVAKFEKVSKNQFEEAWKDTFGTEQTVYEELRLPRRATKGSAGYFSPRWILNCVPGKPSKSPPASACGLTRAGC